MTPQTDAELEARRVVTEILANCAAKYADPDYWASGAARTPQDVIESAVTLGVRLLKASDFERLVRADERAVLKMNKADKCITEHFRKRTKL